MSQIIFIKHFRAHKVWWNSYVNIVNSTCDEEKRRALGNVSYITVASKFHVITHFPVIIIFLLFFRFLLFLLLLLVGCSCVFFLFSVLSLVSYVSFFFVFCSFFSWVWRSTCNFIILKQDWSGILLARVEAYTPNQAKNKKWIYYMSLVSYFFFYMIFMIHTLFIFMLFTSQWQGAKKRYFLSS